MTRWLVTRHPGALVWLRQQGVEATALAHLDPARISPGDEIYGTLPLHLAAEVSVRGARFFYLAIDVPAELRGQELDAALMSRLGARLQEYRVLPAEAR